jgi:hypothetical protein
VNEIGSKLSTSWRKLLTIYFWKIWLL